MSVSLGKGTISDRILKTFKIVHLSTGDLLRNNIEQKTALGEKFEVGEVGNFGFDSNRCGS